MKALGKVILTAVCLAGTWFMAYYEGTLLAKMWLAE